MSGKMYLKDKLEDDELDLSMMQLTEVPVKEIEQLGTKVMKLNLSHNLLTSVPANLPLLSHLTSLDLSKNKIVELPENFGQLTKLKTLDLYGNRISKLPVSFAQLKSLKWLDLKENPLVPELEKATGPCLTKTDCELAAKKVVARLQSIESQLFQEKKKRLEMEEKARRYKARKEEAERERLRQEKKLAKEKRREEARQKEVESKDQYSEHGVNERSNGTSSSTKSQQQNGHKNSEAKAMPNSGYSCVGLLLKVFMFVMVATLALGCSLIWLYTDGKMDSQSIQRAMPVLQKDVEKTVHAWEKSTVKMFRTAEKKIRPYAQSTLKNGGELLTTVKKKTIQGANWIMEHPVWQWLKQNAVLLFNQQKEFFNKRVLPFLNSLWKDVRPSLEYAKERTVEALKTFQKSYPVYLDWMSTKATAVYKSIETAVHNFVQAQN